MLPRKEASTDLNTIQARIDVIIIVNMDTYLKIVSYQKGKKIVLNVERKDIKLMNARMR